MWSALTNERTVFTWPRRDCQSWDWAPASFSSAAGSQSWPESNDRPAARLYIKSIDQSEDSIQVTWSRLANQRPVFTCSPGAPGSKEQSLDDLPSFLNKYLIAFLLSQNIVVSDRLFSQFLFESLHVLRSELKLALTNLSIPLVLWNL